MVSSSDCSSTPLSSVIEEVIATSSGTSFYVLSQGGLIQDTAGSGAVFLTQDEGLYCRCIIDCVIFVYTVDIEGSVQTFATESLVIADAKYIETRKGYVSLSVCLSVFMSVSCLSLCLTDWIISKLDFAPLFLIIWRLGRKINLEKPRISL